MKEKQVCEICKRQSYLDEHHIQSLSKGGNDKPYNKARICGACHKEVHFGDVIIEGRFASTRGNIIIWRRQGESSVTGMEDPDVWLYK